MPSPVPQKQQNPQLSLEVDCTMSQVILVLHPSGLSAYSLLWIENQSKLFLKCLTVKLMLCFVHLNHQYMCKKPSKSTLAHLHGPCFCHRCNGVGHFRHAGLYGHVKPRHWHWSAKEEWDACRCRLQAPAPTDLSTPTSPTDSPSAPSASKLPGASAPQGAVVRRVPEGERQLAARGAQEQQEGGEYSGDELQTWIHL